MVRNFLNVDQTFKEDSPWKYINSKGRQRDCPHWIIVLATSKKKERQSKKKIKSQNAKDRKHRQSRIGLKTAGVNL
jgi:hypothetical protein